MFAFQIPRSLLRSSTAGVGIAAISRRAVSTLQGNPHIYVFPSTPVPSNQEPTSHILSLLPTTPPTPALSLGTTTAIPPTPQSFSENPAFLPLLHRVLAEYATHDPDTQAQAQAMASTAGAGLGSGGVFFPGQRQRQEKRRGGKSYGGGGGAGGDGAGGASAQGGAGGGGVGGWIHVSDQRNPPDFAFPEDIFGSLEVDGHGQFVGEHGSYQPSGTYRIVTREGIFGLSPFLREKLVERLRTLEKQQ
ncbi:MAG: hypothetical protein M1819_006516 [Sarea resinae]|nr:MAG: hypothetical protein M1819_000608 [Sarea resinae]KAI9828809.1 MAG: hypothetical protein M1819_006516 [Sarea resinae]